MGADDFYSAGNNFGYSYTPDLAAQYGGGTPQDPKKTYYSGEMPPEQRIPAYQSSDAHWDSADVVAIRNAIFTLHDGHLNGAATGWEKIVQLLDHVKKTMSDAGNALAPGWDPAKSTAAANFFHHIGASMWSIDEWITFGNQNKHALESVAKAVNKARSDIEKIYNNFLSEWNTNIDKANYVGSPGWLQDQLNAPPDYNVGLATSPTKSADEERQEYIDAATAARDKYSKQARVVIKTLTGEYASNWGAINEGRKFQGPTNAESPLAALQDKLNQIMANAGGGGNFGNPATFNTQNNALQLQLKQQADEAAKKAAEAEAAAKAAKEAQEKALAQQQAAAEQAKQQALEQQQLAQQQLEQQQSQLKGLGDPVVFPVTGAGAAGLQGAGGLGNAKGGTGANFGNLKGFAINEPGFGGGGAGSSSLLGRSGAAGLGGAGGAGGGGLGRNALQGRLGEQQPGGGQPPGGTRRSDERGKEDGRQPGGGSRPESEEYLSDLPGGPGTMSARLAGETFGGPMGAPPPPSTSLPGRGSPLGQHGGRPGPPGQGVPPGRTRPGEELTGRRRRTDDVEIEDELLAPPMLNRPNLTGRAGLPAIERVAGPGMGAESSMLGARGKKAAPDMAERLGRRRAADKVQEIRQPVEAGAAAEGTPESELWTVDVPETIDTPVERKPDERRGEVLGPGA